MKEMKKLQMDKIRSGIIFPELFVSETNTCIRTTLNSKLWIGNNENLLICSSLSTAHDKMKQLFASSNEKEIKIEIND